MDDRLPSPDAITAAAAAIASADHLLIAAGAGMGVDSGLPDFRGSKGFWRAYPPFAGRSFAEMANPSWFDRQPRVAWGFYGHRRQLYRSTQPHEGFGILKGWAASRDHFVFTSNIDGHFQRAGFVADRILECHGSLAVEQCHVPCRADPDGIWPASDEDLVIDETRFECVSLLPRCPRCGKVSRPNVLMFGDSRWLPHRTAAQQRRFGDWAAAATGRIVSVELGAGTAVPTVRLTTEQLADVVVRINPREPQGPSHVIGIAGGALETLLAIDDRLS